MKPKPNRNRKIFPAHPYALRLGPSRHVDRVADPIQDVATDVEAEVFHGSVVAALVHARADALLHRLADRPVLGD